MGFEDCEDAIGFVAGVNDDGFMGGGIAEDGTVALQKAYGKDFVDQVCGHTGIIASNIAKQNSRARAVLFGEAARSWRVLSRRELWPDTAKQASLEKGESKLSHSQMVERAAWEEAERVCLDLTCTMPCWLVLV